MILLYLLAAACVAVSLVTAMLRNRGLEKGRLACKLTASMLFCLIAFLAATMRETQLSARAALMLAALLLGLIGDILLGLDHFVQDNCQTFIFIVGGVPFFLGHVLYIWLLLLGEPLEPRRLLLLPLMPLLFLLLQRLKVVSLDKLLLPLMAYGLVLGAMMLSTLNLALRGGALGRLMLFPGILFAVSDTSLFLGKFGKEKLERVRPVFAYTVMLPYYAAQALFAMAIVYL